MSLGLKIPTRTLFPLIEWRARRIADPVERLRYLRRATGGELSRSKVVSFRAWGPAATFLMLLLLAPIDSNSGANSVGIQRPSAGSPDRRRSGATSRSRDRRASWATSGSATGRSSRRRRG